jgi:uridine kinase
MNRVVVIGNSSSGKTTLSRQLAASLDVSLLELDAIFHQADWEQLPDDQFRATVDEFTAVDHWVVDGNYTSWHAGGPLAKGRHGRMARPPQIGCHESGDQTHPASGDHP